MRDHTKLRAFELADDLVLKTYKETAHFPKQEMFGLTSQLRRAAVSIPSNIVEGCSRSSEGGYLRLAFPTGLDSSEIRRTAIWLRARRRLPKFSTD
ncbi:MAG: four helix bundle protein [Verrucomicrobia bacterium]|nr:four helix bundle protein [Verrucomicrobiota bacterium]